MILAVNTLWAPGAATIPGSDKSWRSRIVFYNLETLIISIIILQALNVSQLAQADLDSLIRSKAAMYTILEILTGSVGITPEDLESFYVAGMFGAFINPESAITIGMLPDLPLDRYKPLGNSSLGVRPWRFNPTNIMMKSIRSATASLTWNSTSIRIS